jgi:polyhydroxyalkanoate synthase
MPKLPTPRIPTPGLSTLQAPIAAVGRVRREVERHARRARNGIRLAAGVDTPAVGQTPKEVVWERDRCQLWRYRSDRVAYHPPLFIVFSLVSRSYILDLTPGNSFVEHLRDAGFDVFLLDWGVPDERDAANTVEDYVDGYLPAGIERALEVSGAGEVNLLGYCFGGVLSLLSMAHHADLPVRSLTTIATPVDYSGMGFMGELFRRGRLEVDDLLDDTGNLPAGVVRQAFRVLKPTAEVGRYATLFENLGDDRYLLAYQAMTQWTNEHIPFPGAAARQTVEMLVNANGAMTDRLHLGGEAVSLSDITCPFLNVVAERDHIVPPAAARPLVDLVGSAEPEQLLLDAGHIGLAVGRSAARVTIPTIIEFLQRRSVPVGGEDRSPGPSRRDR